MDLGPEALLFAQAPLIWLGVPMAAWLGYIMWRVRSDRYSVVWWLLLSLTILAAGLAIENAFYLLVRAQRLWSPGAPFLDPLSHTLAAAGFKGLYVAAFIVAGSAILELIVHVNAERRVAERILQALALVTAYGLIATFILW